LNFTNRLAPCSANVPETRSSPATYVPLKFAAKGAPCGWNLKLIVVAVTFRPVTAAEPCRGSSSDPVQAPSFWSRTR
jgi:hypothetical protein